jgi:hypothetical protein
VTAAHFIDLSFFHGSVNTAPYAEMLEKKIKGKAVPVTGHGGP